MGSESTAVAARGEVGAVTRGAESSDPMGIVQYAIEHQVPVEVLERLVDLQEKVADRNARAAFISALAAFQDECPEIRKTKQVEYASRDGGRVDYHYAPLEEITRTIRPILTRHGLSYTWDSSLVNGALEVVFNLRHIDGHSEQSRFTSPIDTAAKMSGPQKSGAALTYGRRQSLIQGLGLTTVDDDNDGDDGSGTADSGEKCTPAQIADLIALGNEVKADPERFLKWAKISALEDLPASKYRDAVTLLEGMRK